MKVQNKFIFTNWAGNHIARPEKYFQPETEAEIIDVITRANQENKKIKLVGAGHSWSSIACTDDYMINLDHYARVIKIDRDKMQITVQAGIRLYELSKVLNDNGLALVNLGSISKQSIAGATATGTHGTGINFGIISSQIITLKLIAADGSIHRANESSPDGFLNLARVSLGALGVVSEITLQCTKQFSLEEKAAPMLFTDAIKQLPQMLKSNNHLKLWWFPHVDYLQVYRYNRTTRDIKPSSRMEAWFNESFMARFVFTFLLRLGMLTPERIPSINHLIKTLHFKLVDRVDLSNKIFQVPMPPKHRECEYAIPVEMAGEALAALKNDIETYQLYVNFVVEVRFVKADEIALSPAYHRNSCYIGAYMYGEKGWKKYMELFEGIMKKYNGRPHWGKEFSIDPAQIRALYPKYDEFKEAMQRLDAKGMFTNAFLEKVFSL